MIELIATDKFIKKAKEKGVNFGKGSPYNRLRYYTKLGWIPHMTRQKNKRGDVVGHYPKWIIDRLLLIQKLKKRNYTNDEITQKIKTLDAKRNFLKSINVFNSPEKRLKTISYISFIILLIIFITEMGILPANYTKNDLLKNTQQLKNSPNQILDSGTGLFPANEKIIYIRSGEVTSTSKINVTFEKNYSPATNYWVSKKIPHEGFYIELNAPVRTNSVFNWFISN